MNKPAHPLIFSSIDLAQIEELMETFEKKLRQIGIQ